MRRRARQAAPLALLLLLPACRDAQSATAPVVVATRVPFVDAPLRTTDPGIALGNLNAQIAGFEQRAAAGGPTIGQRAGLAELLAARGQFTGRIADRERAGAIGEELAREAPDDPIALIARARGRAAFHRFADALADLDRAAARGAPPATVGGIRAGIWQALGRYDEALAVRRDAVARRPNSDTQGALASLLAERGEVAEAAALYAEARGAYRDISPFPYAWLLFDEGLMWMRHGDPARARELFAAAVQRLPGYAAAQCHLAEVEAELGNPEQAIVRLTPLAEAADDPDPAAQLARIAADAGRPEEAAKWRAIALARYEELLERHPEAFADHGAEFWLAAGNDPGRALVLARRNLAVRKTARAYELIMAAAAAADEPAVLCETRAAAARTVGGSASLADLLARAQAQCASGPNPIHAAERR